MVFQAKIGNKTKIRTPWLVAGAAKTGRRPDGVRRRIDPLSEVCMGLFVLFSPDGRKSAGSTPLETASGSRGDRQTANKALPMVSRASTLGRGGSPETRRRPGRSTPCGNCPHISRVCNGFVTILSSASDFFAPGERNAPTAIRTVGNTHQTRPR